MCVGAVAWPRRLLYGLKLAEHRWWFLLESAGYSSSAHLPFIKKESLQRGPPFLLFSWFAVFFEVSVWLLSRVSLPLFWTCLMKGGSLYLWDQQADGFEVVSCHLFRDGAWHRPFLVWNHNGKRGSLNWYYISGVITSINADEHGWQMSDKWWARIWNAGQTHWDHFTDLYTLLLWGLHLRGSE